MLFCILLYYVTKLVPDQITRIRKTVGDEESGISKLLSLRDEVWYQDEDSMWMKLGYSIEQLMNGMCSSDLRWF